MAIALDAVSTSGFTSTSIGSKSWTHTTGAGLANSILIVATENHFDAIANSNVTAVSYGGSPLSRIIRANNGVAVASVEFWYMLGPAAGANTVQVTFGGNCTNGNLAAVSLSGVDQANPLDVAAVQNTAAAGSTSNSKAIVTGTDNAWILDAVDSGSGAPTMAPTAGQTALFTQLVNSSVFLAGRKLITPAGSFTSSYSITPSSSGASALAVIALRAAASAVSGQPMTLLGVGN